MSQLIGKSALIVILAATILLGNRGCGDIWAIWAETDGVEYQVGEEGLTTLHNDHTRRQCRSRRGFPKRCNEPIYLPGCETFSYERMDGEQWVNMGPDVVCVWEGIVRPLAAGTALASPFVATEEGVWRLRYSIGLDCTEGVPMSEADCSSMKSVYTPAFSVVPAEDWLGEGEECGADVEGECAPDLLCCYPCGIPGCHHVCTVPCDPNESWCAGGCPAYP
jgi:hypothetical protein